MWINKILQPKTALSREEVTRGLRALTLEGIVSTGFYGIVTSTFLIAFALALGANNLQIGILAALPFLTDLLQIPAVWFIEKFRRRKALVLVPWLVAQLLWVPVILIPFIMNIPGGGAVSLLLGLMALRGIINAFTNCGWNSWIRDLVPRHILGRYLAKRESVATAVAVVLGLGAGYALDLLNNSGGGIAGYSIVLGIGLIFFGLLSPAVMAFIPEPVMPVVKGPHPSFTRMIASPFRQGNSRRFMKFLFVWGIASNIAIPFFAVFMLQYLKLSVFTVIVLTTVSEIFTVLTLRSWGQFADKYGSKPVLYFSIFLFLLTLVGWISSAVAGIGAVMLPFLAVLHVLLGISLAGITLTVGTLSYKIAPDGKSTSFLAAASLSESVGIGFGALAAGFIADFLSGRTFNIGISGTGSGIQISGYHLLFVLALVLGILTLQLLHNVRETGSVRSQAVQRNFIKYVFARFSQSGLTPGWDFAGGRLYKWPFIVRDTYANEFMASGLFMNTGEETKRVFAAVKNLDRKPPPGRFGLLISPAC